MESSTRRAKQQILSQWVGRGRTAVSTGKSGVPELPPDEVVGVRVIGAFEIGYLSRSLFPIVSDNVHPLYLRAYAQRRKSYKI